MTTKEWLSQYPVLQAKYYRMYGDEDNQLVVDRLREQLDAIEKAIDTVGDLQCSEVLILRYTEGPTGRLMKWKDVAFAMYHNDTDADLKRVYKLHREALAMVKLPRA